MATVQKMGCKEAKAGRREIIQEVFMVIQRNNNGSLNKEMQEKEKQIHQDKFQKQSKQKL